MRALNPLTPEPLRASPGWRRSTARGARGAGRGAGAAAPGARRSAASIGGGEGSAGNGGGQGEGAAWRLGMADFQWMGGPHWDGGVGGVGMGMKIIWLAVPGTGGGGNVEPMK